MMCGAAELEALATLFAWAAVPPSVLLAGVALSLGWLLRWSTE